MKYRIEKGFTAKYLYIGEDEIKYDITGCVSLREEYSGKRISLDGLLLLMDELVQMGHMIEKTNMDINRLLASPDYIYIKCVNRADRKKMKIHFLYYPGTSKVNIDTSLSRLAEFIIEKIDYSDNKAVRAAYDIYMQIFKGNYVFDTSLWK